jgi:hypothetical protein
LISLHTSPSSTDKNASPTQPMIQIMTGAMLWIGSWLPPSPATITSTSMPLASARATAASAPTTRPLACQSICQVISPYSARRNKPNPTNDNATVAPAPHM